MLQINLKVQMVSSSKYTSALMVGLFSDKIFIQQLKTIEILDKNRIKDLIRLIRRIINYAVGKNKNLN